MSALAVNNLSGSEAKAISIACQEFEKKLNVAWKNYLVFVDETPQEFVVSFRSKSATKELRGSPNGVPGFEIRLNKEGYEVVSFQFSR